ncbi:hypothetical protein RB195_003176 [Necator americanus]|uniref:Transmembrane protein n=1 Tax=Necator americanus TaxID=51031 RepID=A0ABR1DMH0_NECAM
MWLSRASFEGDGDRNHYKRMALPRCQVDTIAVGGCVVDVCTCRSVRRFPCPSTMIFLHEKMKFLVVATVLVLSFIAVANASYWRYAHSGNSAK